MSPTVQGGGAPGSEGTPLKISENSPEPSNAGRHVLTCERCGAIEEVDQEDEILPDCDRCVDLLLSYLPCGCVVALDPEDDRNFLLNACPADAKGAP